MLQPDYESIEMVNIRRPQIEYRDGLALIDPETIHLLEPEQVYELRNTLIEVANLANAGATFDGWKVVKKPDGVMQFVQNKDEYKRRGYRFEPTISLDRGINNGNPEETMAAFRKEVSTAEGSMVIDTVYASKVDFDQIATVTKSEVQATKTKYIGGSVATNPPKGTRGVAYPQELDDLITELKIIADSHSFNETVQPLSNSANLRKGWLGRMLFRAEKK